MRYLVAAAACLALATTCPPRIGAQEPALAGPVQFMTHDNAFAYVPPEVAGDREFDGNGPDVTVRAVVGLLPPDSVGVYLCLYMRAVETGGDRSEARGWSKPLPLGFVDSGYRGSDIRTPHRATLDTLTNGHERTVSRPRPVPDEHPTSNMLNPLVRQWTVFGDSATRHDIGNYTRVEVFLNPIEINRYPTEQTTHPDSAQFAIYDCEGLVSRDESE